jgi:chlorite dismutase
MADASRGGKDELPRIDVAERAGHHTGNSQVIETRLFMQLLVFDCAPDAAPDAEADALAHALAGRGAAAVLYADAHAPRGLGLLTWSEDPAHFVGVVRAAVVERGASLVQRAGWTILGRTYATGYEPDLRWWLLDRAVENVTNASYPWAVWYPLRRSGAFARLPDAERAEVLKEHGLIGRAYGAQDLAHDIRLACHGLHAYDNEFVIGLVGKDLHPLSHIVERMRKTRQTSEFIEKMGPFFVGRVLRRVPSSK